jgi:hypothetical protein
VRTTHEVVTDHRDVDFALRHRRSPLGEVGNAAAPLDGNVLGGQHLVVKRVHARCRSSILRANAIEPLRMGRRRALS